MMTFFKGKYAWPASYLGAAFIVFMVTAVAWVLYEREARIVETQHQRNLVSTQLDRVAGEIENAIARQASALEALGNVVSLDPEISKAKFEAFSTRTFLKYEEFKHVALAPDLVVTMAYPAQGNEGAIGLNYRENAAQYAAVDRAIKDGGIVVAGPVDLVQGGEGLIIRTAVQTSDFGAFGSRLWGIASLVLDLDTILTRAGLYDLDLNIALRGKDGLGENGGMIRGAPVVFTQSPISAEVRLPNGTWFLGAVPKQGWVIASSEFLRLRLVFAGCGLTFLMFVFAVMRLLQLRMRSDAQLATAVNHISDGFAFYDSNDRLALCNDKYREIYQVSAPAMVPGTKFEDIIRYGLARQQYPEAIGREEEFLKTRLKAHQSGGVDVEQQLDDGRWLKILETKTPDGGTVGFRVDITELKNARDAAESANKAKSEFLDVMSHELRTPLTVVLGGTPFLCRPELLPTATKLFNTLEARGEEAEDVKAEVDALLSALKSLAGKVDRSAKHLLTLINDVLDFSKIEAGKLDLDIQPTNLDEAIEDLLHEYGPKADAKALTLTADVPEIFVEADQLRLRQVLINIVGNAIKFTETGGITISADNRGKLVKIKIQDTGCGIPADRLDEVFNKFSQVDSSSTRKVGGTGLGMAISKKIIEMHGGTISVESKVGEGSTFTFTLQRAIAAVDPDDMGSRLVKTA